MNTSAIQINVSGNSIELPLSSNRYKITFGWCVFLAVIWKAYIFVGWSKTKRILLGYDVSQRVEYENVEVSLIF